MKHSYLRVLTGLALATAWVASAQVALLTVEDAYPHVAADGRVVFQSNRAGGTKLFVARLDGTPVTRPDKHG